MHVQDQTDFATSQAFASDLVQEMTLPEKAGQLAQVEKNSITPDEVAEYAIGSVLSGGGGNPNPNTPENWARMVSDYVEAGRRSRLGIPVLYGVDAVHGHNNVVGATIFPHNIGLGSAGDTDLTERVFRAVALEVAATGIRWSFAPAVSVARDPRWGRTYESFGDDPALVAELAAAALRGLHWDRLDNASLSAQASISFKLAIKGSFGGKPLQQLDHIPAGRTRAVAVPSLGISVDVEAGRLFFV